MDEARTVEARDVRRRHPPEAGRSGRQVRDATRVARRTRTLEIDEISHRPEQLVDLVAIESAVTIRRLRQRRGPDIDFE